MADFNKLKDQTGKAKNRFGAPPAPEVKSSVLEAPETAPAIAEPNKRKARNKTGRTVPFGTKVTAEFDTEFREWAFKNRLKNAELLERMLAADKKING